MLYRCRAHARKSILSPRSKCVPISPRMVDAMRISKVSSWILDLHIHSEPDDSRFLDYHNRFRSSDSRTVDNHSPFGPSDSRILDYQNLCYN
ncbi:hypothetical protein TNCT_600341 [Trichonephila clavata]|uniref:Uncharacterized protein n=1 Tax=Trichonephila clavata TaxID=2740835 RepID=A0A8X6KSC6_TRICU|nr:hypothetical protein TNCT_600341 [Trichonephila clavata]